MKRDRIPYKLNIPLMPKLSILVLLYELTRCESPVYFEPTVSVDDGWRFCRVPAKVVQEGGDSVDFEVDAVTEGFVGIDHEDSVEPRPHDVLVDGVGTMLQRECFSILNDWRVDDWYAGDFSRRIWQSIGVSFTTAIEKGRKKDNSSDPMDEHDDVICAVLLSSEGFIIFIWPLSNI